MHLSRTTQPLASFQVKDRIQVRCLDTARAWKACMLVSIVDWYPSYLFVKSCLGLLLAKGYQALCAAKNTSSIRLLSWSHSLPNSSPRGVSKPPFPKLSFFPLKSRLNLTSGSIPTLVLPTKQSSRLPAEPRLTPSSTALTPPTDKRRVHYVTHDALYSSQNREPDQTR